MGLCISARIKEKLAQKTPPVTEQEIIQCFANRRIANGQGCYLLDTREQHRTEPPTKWFIAETDFGRKLKIVFILEGPDVTIKTAYDPNAAETRIYNSNCLTE